MGSIFIGLGSNQGDRAGHLAKALDLMQQSDIEILASSSLYETPPWGELAQPPFLNQVVAAEWKSNSFSLMKLLLEVEGKMGRQRVLKWGPRIIDLDLLDFKGQSVDTDELKLPHPWLAQRAFVLVPWAEIAPDYRPECLSHTIRELMLQLPQEEVEAVKIWAAR